MESDSKIEFPEYGAGGNVAGARRSRHAFRLTVSAVLFLTVVVWFSERYLRHEHTERLFLIALTLPRESARPVLIQAIEHDRANNAKPKPKYSQALAVREEDNVILRKFKEAYEMDPSDSLFALRYGCYLIAERPDEAVRVFQEAAQHPPENGLLGYLEAAALARAGDNRSSLEEAVAIVARTNNEQKNIVFPKPIWFSPSVLPQSGVWYADLSRDIVRQVCGPIAAFADRVLVEAQQQIVRGNEEIARIWLEHLRRMGRRIASSTEPTTAVAALTGLSIEHDAISALEVHARNTVNPAADELIEQRIELEQAISSVRAFEQERFGRIELVRQEYFFPLELALRGTAYVTIVFLLVWFVYKLLGLRKATWTLAHHRMATSAFLIFPIVLVAILHGGFVLQGLDGYQGGAQSTLFLAWHGALLAFAVYGLVYPAFALPHPAEMSRRLGRPEEMGEMLPSARKAFRVAWISLVRRFYGVGFGLYIASLCVWFLSYRIVSGLYPNQIKLLTPGLMEEEAAVVVAALAGLR